MGWSFISGADKDFVVREITETSTGVTPEGKPTRFETMQYSVRGRVLYAAHRAERGDEVTTFIGVYLLGTSNGDWGYKAMDEGMHPYQYDCPLYLFDLAPVPPSPQAAKWREEVRKKAARKRSLTKPSVGATIHFAPGVRFGSQLLTTAEIVDIRKSKVYVRINDILVRVMPRHIARIDS